jgi:AraC-like DNA-binding protein
MRDVACKTYVELECLTENALSFTSKICAGQISNIGLSTVITDQCDVIRTKESIKGSSADEILLSLQQSGTTTLVQDNRETRLTAGHFALYDTQRSYKLHVEEDTEQLVIKIPRQQLEAQLGNITLFTAQKMSFENPLSKLAFNFITTLPSICDDLNEGTAETISKQAIDIISQAFSHECRHNGTPIIQSRFTTLMRLKSEIETHLNNHEFKPSNAAALIGISVRYANELLSAENTSLEKYIYERRLERCRKNLINPKLKTMSIAEIAHTNGFTSASHFSRRFKEKHHMTPQNYRKEKL